MQINWRSHLLLYTLTILLFGFPCISCDEAAPVDDDDDADDGDGNEFLISVDGSMKLSVVTGYEAYQICKDIRDGINRVIDRELQCLRTAIAVGQNGGNYDEEMCNESFLGCAPEDQRDYQICDKYEETSDKYEDCDAKVSEMDKCMKKTIDALEDEYEDLSCASENMTEPDEIEPSGACEELEEKCPGITTNFDRQF